MDLYRAFRQIEFPADQLVGLALDNKRENLRLTIREADLPMVRGMLRCEAHGIAVANAVANDLDRQVHAARKSSLSAFTITWLDCDFGMLCSPIAPASMARVIRSLSSEADSTTTGAPRVAGPERPEIEMVEPGRFRSRSTRSISCCDSGNRDGIVAIACLENLQSGIELIQDSRQSCSYQGVIVDHEDFHTCSPLSFVLLR